MNLQQMRKIDAWAGRVACFFLETCERCRSVFSSKREMPQDIGKILITKYIGMGSIILATPMLKALKKGYPQSKITFLTFENNAEFARNIPLIDEVLAIRTSSFFLFAKDLFQAILKIRRDKFDVAFDLEFFARFSTIVSYLSGTKTRIGYYLPKMWRGDLLTHQVHFNPYKHVTVVFSAQLAPLGIEATDSTLARPEISHDKLQQVASLLKAKGLRDGEEVIAVNINSSDLSIERRWPQANFIELIRYILENRTEVKVVLVGSKGETGYVRAMHDSLPPGIKNKAINLSGGLGIEEFMALLKMSALFITNDSGPLHIAAALGTPTVSFFGPESPSLYGPLGEKHLVFYAGIYCSPCLNVYNAKTAMCKGNNICMKELPPALVIAALEKEGLL